MTDSKLVCGVGINDKSRPTKISGKYTREYVLWKAMLERCYYQRLHARRQTYIDCCVSDNFKHYSQFYDWCQQQIGFHNDGFQLDKDIIVMDNKTYSENTCSFVPREINIFFADCGATRGEWPIGVYFHKASGKFRAKCRVNGKQKTLGCFTTPDCPTK